MEEIQKMANLKIKSELCGWTAEEMIAGSEVVGARKAKAGVGSL